MSLTRMMGVEGSCCRGFRNTAYRVFRNGTDLLFFLRRPITNPTTNATVMATKMNPIISNRRHPPLRAIYLLFLTSASFSPFGPVASQTLYFGGGPSKLCLGGSPIFHRRLKNRLCVLSGNGGGGTASSAMMDSRVSMELARLRMLRLPPTFFGRGGGAGGRSTKLLCDIGSSSRSCAAMPGGLQGSGGGRCSSSSDVEGEE